MPEGQRGSGPPSSVEASPINPPEQAVGSRDIEKTQLPVLVESYPAQIAPAHLKHCASHNWVLVIEPDKGLAEGLACLFEVFNYAAHRGFRQRQPLIFYEGERLVLQSDVENDRLPLSHGDHKGVALRFRNIYCPGGKPIRQCLVGRRVGKGRACLIEN